MDGESADGPLLIKEGVKISAQVLPTSVRSKGLDLSGFALSSRPCPVHLIGLEGLVFGPLQVQGRISGVVIGETNIIFSSTFSPHWGWSPQIGMDLITK